MRLVSLSALATLTAAFAPAGLHSDGPMNIDPHRPCLTYLHGAIVTGSDGRPVSPRFGIYEYRQILDRFAQSGFEVISQIRRDDDVTSNCARVVGWIRELKSAGVPSSRIAVVGASIGGIIASRVSHELKDREISYVLVASLYRLKSLPAVPLSGRVLSIHDATDRRDWIEAEFFANAPGLVARKTVVSNTGKGHGLLFRPDDAWFLPTLDWLAGLLVPTQPR